MKRYQYEITRHPSDQFSDLVYFCSDQGECSLNQIPMDQMGVLRQVLNERGGQGWELVQLFFGKEGILAFWKREAA
ncbi:MAG: hypothetical protein JXL84_24765 [Deltaproteobacteria bacterium]|nr:hypothetical protein [Deltaproteobacteria bacterium]